MFKFLIPGLGGLVVILIVVLVAWILLRKKASRARPQETLPKEPRDLKEGWEEAAAEREAFFREFEAKLSRIRSTEPTMLPPEDRQDVEAVNTLLLGKRAMGERWTARDYFYMGFSLSVMAWEARARAYPQKAEEFFAEAAEHYRKAIGMNEFMADAHNGLGNALWGLGIINMDRGDRDRARALFKESLRASKKALALDDGLADACFNMGAVWEGMSLSGSRWKMRRSLSKAINFFKMALAKDPDHLLAQEFLMGAEARLKSL